MGTNKDQAQAHQFMLQRVIAAITVHETDPEQPPFRRPLLAAIGGIVIGALIMAGFWVFGLLVPGGDRFTDTDVIVVEEETGARFVFLNGRLHPVFNYTSALLALDQHAEVRVVSRATLAGIPRGQRIGIPDAPDPLPGREELLTGGWSMCDQSTMDDQGRRQDQPVLLVGQSPGGDPVHDAGLLVRSDNKIYVVRGGYRHEITSGVQVALGLDNEPPVTVGSTWLNTLAAGKPIAPVPLSDPGRPSAAVPGKGLVSGQLLEVDSGASTDDVDKQYYLVSGDQLQPISPLQANVQRVLGPHADPTVPVDNRELVNAAFADAPPSEEDDPPWALPRFLTVDDPDVTVCATFQPGDVVPALAVDARLPASAQAGSVRVAVQPGRAALIEVMSGPDETPGQGTVALVTDQGRLYPLEDPGHVLQVLGFDGVSPVRITSVLADRLPSGPSLSPDTARTPAVRG
jgi:type VII secretion protein EccB